MSSANRVVDNGIHFKRVLIATDFSDISRNALRYASAIARNHGARLYVAHVVSSVGYRMAGPDAEVQAAELAARDLKELWGKLAGDDQSPGVELALIVRRGEVCAQLEDLIQKENIDLVVVGTHGRAGFSKVVLGSVAEEVFRKVSCPVLTVGPNSAWDWPEREVGAEKTVLFATDFGDDSLKALPYAVSIANRSGSTLVLLHVAKFIGRGGDASYSGGTLDAVREVIRQTSMQRLKELAPKNLKLEPECEVIFSSPADGILSTAKSTAAGLVP
jgi:nucleotide-binding universal stress UspA family protein